MYIRVRMDEYDLYTEFSYLFPYSPVLALQAWWSSQNSDFFKFVASGWSTGGQIFSNEHNNCFTAILAAIEEGRAWPLEILWDPMGTLALLGDPTHPPRFC